MRLRSLLSVALPCLACIPSAFCQLPKRLEKCLPYPTLAGEMREIQPAAPQVRIRVVRVGFDSTDDVPTETREQISAQIENLVFERPSDTTYLDDLAKEIAEVSVTGALQDRGYFRARATAKLTVLQTKGLELAVAIAISATPGPQYRLGDMRIESADSLPLSISPAVLRPLVPLQAGDLLSVERIRTGLQNITRAYGREGYVDMTAEPDLDIDEANKVIDMVLKIDQQVQYRVGSIEFLGISAATQQI